MKSTLSPARQRLVDLLQTINFGRIEDLVVRDGDPVFDPPPRVVREVKFGGENGPRPEQAEGNYYLKGQVVELFRHLDRLGNGNVKSLEFKNGLPFHMLIEEVDV